MKERVKPRLRPAKRRVTWSLAVSGAIALCVVVVLLALLPRNTNPHPTQNSSSQQPGAGDSNISIVRQAGSPIPTTPTFTPGSYTSINSRLFSNSSPWNVAIGNNVQLDPRSASMVNELNNCCHVPTTFQFGMPIYTSTSSDPTYRVHDSGGDEPFEADQPIHIPNDAAPSPGSDHWLFIFDKTKNLIFEMWNTEKDGGSWNTQAGDVYSPTGNGVLQVDGSPQGGNGASYFGGVVTDADIRRGFINHALSFATQYTSGDSRYPMRTSDGGDGDIPMGARLQLNPSVNCKTLPGASKGEKMVCQALETYGGYVRDTGGVTLSMYFEGENLNDPDRDPPDGSPGNPSRSGAIFDAVGLHDSQDLSDIPWGKLRVLKAWNSFSPATPTPLAIAAPSTSGSASQGPSAFFAYNSHALGRLLPVATISSKPQYASFDITRTARALLSLLFFHKQRYPVYWYL